MISLINLISYKAYGIKVSYLEQLVCGRLIVHYSFYAVDWLLRIAWTLWVSS